MNITLLQEIIVDALDDIKARDIVVFDTTKGTAEFDRVIIATADVARQTRAMALNVIDKVKAAGGRIVGMEGGGSGEWVLVDCSDAVVPIMQPAARQHYNLEELWGQKKVKVMSAADKAADAAAKVMVKAQAAQAAKAVQVARQASVKASAKKAPKKVASKSPAGTGRSKQAPLTTAAVKQRSVTKALRKPGSTKKAPAKKAPAKKAPATKAPVKKAPVKRVAAKKVSARKAATTKTASAPTPKKSAAKKTAKKAAKKC